MFAILLIAAAAAQDPQKHARDLALRIPFAHDAFLELRREAGAITDPALRAAAEAQLLAPWVPAEAWAFGHLEEARKLLADPKLELPPPHRGDFLAAPGGPCAAGPHGHPGGLAVGALSHLLAARDLAQVYRHVYGVTARPEMLATAAIWSDALLAATLPFRADGSCGPEATISGFPAHRVLGVAVALLRHLSKDLVMTIAAAEDPQSACRVVEAASILSDGARTSCAPLPLEAGIVHAARGDQDYVAASWGRYVAAAPKGWDRYEALIQDGNDVRLFSRSP